MGLGIVRVLIQPSLSNLDEDGFFIHPIFQLYFILVLRFEWLLFPPHFFTCISFRNTWDSDDPL